MIGTTVGHYRIVEKIGEGGMGEVYRADDLRLHRPVALKFLSEHLRQDAVARKRFLREAESAAAMEHPYICNIKELGQTDDGRDFIVMEYVEGRTLKQTLQDDGPLSAEEALGVALEVAEALAMAHEKGLIHRDLKPANVMLTPQGHAKVMDFGLAKRVLPEDGEPELTSVTAAGGSPGTPPYMSPEQVQGLSLDHRTDLFSFGTVLYEMLTGSNPFRRSTDMACVAAVLYEEPDALSSRLPDVHPDLEDTLRRLLHKDPDKRVQSAAELHHRLKSSASGHGVDLGWFLRTRSGRRWAAGAMGALALAVVLRAALPGVAPVRTGPTVASIAVLPFTNLSGDDSQEYFVAGMTEELTTALSKISAMVVISQSVTGRYTGSGLSLPEIASQLGVDAILDGSVLREADEVRVSARLIEAESGRSLWDESYRRNLTSVLALQGEVARAVAQEVRVTLTPEETARLTAAREVDPEAYEAYLQGLFHFQKLVPESLDLAERYFERALQYDSTLAQAHAGLSWVWAGRGQMRITPPREAAERSRAHGLTALELDEGLAEAHHALAVGLTWQQWRWDEAWDHWRRALEINPNDGLSNAYYAHFLSIMGLPEQGLTYAERALELDPFSGLFHALYGVTLVFNRRYEDAIAAADYALELDPNLPLDARQLAFIGAGMRDGQLAHQRERIAADPERVEAFERGLEQGGYEGAQIAIADLLAARYSQDGVGQFGAHGIGLRYLDGGDFDRALEWFERAREARDPNMPYIVAPPFDGLRAHPRYPDLIRSFGFPEEVTERHLARSTVQNQPPS
jgi:serine/threonine protein kinase/tetratricopeptide (TPR) repeat protein